MLAHDLKKILAITPEAASLIKSASIEEEFPLNNASSAAASRLRMEYLIKVAHETVDIDTYDLVDKACRMYDVSSKIAPMLQKIAEASNVEFEKAASEEDSISKYALYEFNDLIHNQAPLEKLASVASDLYDRFGDMDSEALIKYACAGKLDKEAAVEAMEARYEATGNSMFTKLAATIEHIDPEKITREQLTKIASMITSLDRASGLQYEGCNFYRDCIVKEAAFEYTCKLAGKNIPCSSIQKLGKDRIGQILGADVAAGLTGDIQNDRQVLETLPLDLQQILVKFL